MILCSKLVNKVGEGPNILKILLTYLVYGCPNRSSDGIVTLPSKMINNTFQSTARGNLEGTKPLFRQEFCRYTE